ncbi:MAG: hypothetical protein KatS3mg004_1882 [Bryobacteraceae bacterium]|nr:MAG: hypothetical protein KatS3mg004_1882 [Bryobacteraceae bacterium]
MPRHNPVLDLPECKELLGLPDASRIALARALCGLASAADTKADISWRRRKAPMAAYWRAVSIYARHIARALKGGR